MERYNQTSISGSTWIRCFNAEFYNPLVTPNTVIQEGHESIGMVSPSYPSMHFAEEQVCNLVDGTIVKQGVNNTNGILFPKESFCPENMSKSFKILDNTGTETGSQMTYEEFYNLIHSFYVHAANNRDVKVANLSSNQSQMNPLPSD